MKKNKIGYKIIYNVPGEGLLSSNAAPFFSHSYFTIRKYEKDKWISSRLTKNGALAVFKSYRTARDFMETWKKHDWFNKNGTYEIWKAEIIEAPENKKDLWITHKNQKYYWYNSFASSKYNLVKKISYMCSKVKLTKKMED